MNILRILTIAAVACVTTCVGDDNTGVPLQGPLWRKVQATHTSDRPVIDRVKVFALSFADVDGDVSRPESEAFLVRPASPVGQKGSVTLGSPEHSVSSLASRMIVGVNAKQIVDDWRTLNVNRYGAFCHVPTYGLEFYRGKTLMFKVSVCWKCHKISLPTIDPKTGHRTVALYGFDDDDSAKKLLNNLRRLVPHPQIRHPSQR